MFTHQNYFATSYFPPFLVHQTSKVTGKVAERENIQFATLKFNFNFTGSFSLQEW